MKKNNKLQNNMQNKQKNKVSNQKQNNVTSKNNQQITDHTASFELEPNEKSFHLED